MVMTAEAEAYIYLVSGYFAIDGILPLEAILLSPFMCVYVAIIATFLAVTL